MISFASERSKLSEYRTFFGVALLRFHGSFEKPKPVSQTSQSQKTSKPINQSKLEMNWCSRREALERVCEWVTIGSGFNSDWTTKWGEIFNQLRSVVVKNWKTCELPPTLERKRDNLISVFRGSRVNFCGSRVNCRGAEKLSRVRKIVSGLALSFIEAEILDSGDQRKIRLTDTTKYRQLYTVRENEGTEF